MSKKSSGFDNNVSVSLGADGNPNKKPFALENGKLVAGVPENAVPSEALYAGKSVPFNTGIMPWDLEAWTGPYDEKNMTYVMVRATVTIPEDGWYVLGAGADWIFRIWIDEILRMDTKGNWNPDPEDHLELMELKAGKHTVDVFLSRGALCAKICLGLYPISDFPRFGAEPCCVDLSKETGKIRKELHGANTTLTLAGRAHNRYEEQLRKLNFTWARTHDWPLWNQGQRMIDTHFIFPLMKLDPSDPSNYYFDSTDEIIRLTQDVAKIKVFYRLGTSIEHTGEAHFNAIPPEDYEKYAEVLAGIVRHYTQGWANGFHYDIQYWEIWNEPNGEKNMWIAPLSTFTPFFVTVLKRLKKEFPNLRFGGPAMGGFDLKKFEPILAACKEAGVEPDFISWHCYSADPDYLIRQPERARRFLDELGFKNTQLCINEWHFLETWEGVISVGITPEQFREAVVDGPNALQGINSGVYNLAVLAGWQDSPLDLGMWYGAGWDSPSWGYKTLFKELSKNYWSLCLFGQFLRDYQVKCLSSSGTRTFLLAGRSEDGSKAGILVADYRNPETRIRIPLKGAEAYGKLSAVVLDKTRNNEPVEIMREADALILNKPEAGSAAYLIMLEK